MGLRVETAAWDDLSVVILTSETALRATERTQAGYRQTDETPPAPFWVRWPDGFVNIVSAWTLQPKLPAYEPVHGFRPREIDGPIVRHFGVADGGEVALR